MGLRSPLDLGLLAESLLFYGKVHLVANRAVLQELVRLIGPDLAVRLAEQEYLEFDYCNQFSGVITENIGGPGEYHEFTVTEMPHTAIDVLAPEVFTDAIGSSGRGRRVAARFLKHVERVGFQNPIAQSATEDASDKPYVVEVATRVLTELAPSYRLPEGPIFRSRVARHQSLGY